MAGAVAVGIEGLVVAYGAVRAVDGLDLRIEPGEILALLGPSGCGKTTTLRALAGLVDVTAGRIAFGGRDVARLPTHRRNVGLVFQNYALFPHMTVFDNVRFGLQMHGVAKGEHRERIGRALDLLRMTEHAAKYPDALSGGQQQRVALARTLVVEPDLVLLDEPLSALDRKLRDEMRVEIRELLKRIDVTSVIVTHDQEEALTIADRVALMNRGRVEQIGTPRELYHAPRTRFAAEFIGRTNGLAGTVRAWRDGEAEIEIAPGATVRARSDAPVAVGTAADCVFRPEAVSLEAAAPAPTAAANSLPGTVVREVFVGEKSEIFIRLDAGPEIVALRASQPGGEAAELGAAGARVAVTWPSATTRIVE